MSIKFTSRMGEFRNKINANQTAALQLTGEFIKLKMDHYVPVDTGLLKSNNRYQVFKNELKIFNNTKYAIYQEYGTYKMKAQPFMRPAIGHVSEIKDIIMSEFGRGL